MTRSAAPAESLRSDLARLATAPDDPGRLHVSTARFPASVDPLDIWRVGSPHDFAAFWEHDGETTAALGVVSGDSGEAGAESAETDASEVRRPPRRLGCLPFLPGWTDEDWRPLTEAGFVLPRWTLYRPAGGRSVRLTLTVRGRPGTEELERIDSELDEIRRVVTSRAAPRADPLAAAGKSWAAVGKPSAVAGKPRGVASGSRRVDGPPANDRAAWDRAVEAALRELGSGSLQKVVLTRRVRERLPAHLEPADVLRALREEGTGPFRFGFRRGGRTFVGASPECLFAKRGRSVEVEALAGTYDMGEESAGTDVAGGLVRAAEHLFASGKDLEEHALVVRGVVEALEPLAETVTADDWPRVREARRLAHLSTTVRARLREGVTPLDLVDALHPTPAVGGLPTSTALDFIRRVEPAPRGSFAAPVGWIGPDGDACMAVGIRSALLLDGHAWVYAGAGIVAASEPESEWDETHAKLRWFRELIDTIASESGG